MCGPWGPCSRARRPVSGEGAQLQGPVPEGAAQESGSEKKALSSLVEKMVFPDTRAELMSRGLGRPCSAREGLAARPCEASKERHG